ncbi:MAG: hypothetical protein L6R42_005719 [Xanthoria sp. 1 TBL-2021]|nr:MAG: hypothetical protein L6R42_005719 [Xanthoria sp. 1 TBL-2021]
MTMSQVHHILKNDGFDISPAVLRSKITEWKLDKKFKSKEMRTALHLILSSGQQWLHGEPTFLINGYKVAFGRILRYYRRRHIYDPFEWFRNQPSDGFQPSADVALLAIMGTVSNDEEDIPRSTVVSPISKHPTAASLPPNNGSSETTVSSRPLLMASDRLYTPLRSPLRFGITEQLVNAAASCCYVYLDSGWATVHSEPEVHQYTIHGRFGLKMQDGISAILHDGNAIASFTHFQSAFDKLGSLIQDIHPMSLAQVYVIICELAGRANTNDASIPGDKKRALQGVLMSLIRHMVNLLTLRTEKEPTSACSPIRDMFVILTKADNVLEQSLKIMQRMVDTVLFAGVPSSNSSYWKILYLQERYCDCLYHAGVQGTRQSLRAQLLKDQEKFYGRMARNVLWTLTNVADDHLHSFRPGEVQDCTRKYSLELRHMTAMAEPKPDLLPWRVLQGPRN